MCPLNLKERELSARTQMFGVAVGIVTNNQDPENLGRVKVQLPWLGSGDDTFWARMAVPMAGKERGTYFLPEVDDEVLVAFDQGSIDHPYVLGGLWNGSDKPPENNSSGRNDIRKIRSRSGHEIIFNDNSSQRRESLEIHTNGGHTILLDDSSGSEKIQIKDKTGSNSIVIDSLQNSVSVESGLQLKLKSQKIDIEAGAMLTLKAGATLTIQGALVKIN
ncbi:MAG: phage baseplate assembly protein V [Calditrichia bacterium]